MSTPDFTSNLTEIQLPAETIPVSKLNKKQRLLLRLADEGKRRLGQARGWRCHYCKAKLIPVDRKGHPYYRFAVVPVDPQAFTPAEQAAAERGELLRWVGVIVHRPHHHQPTLDHILPKAKGGGDNPGNLVLCCARCNGEKGARYSYRAYRQLWADRVKAKAEGEA